jgi:hypothetical protein
MPIHINLLAEAQALEEQRRRDPVKRVILAGAAVVVLILVLSSSLMVKTMVAKGDLSKLEGNLNSRTNEYRQILDNKKKLDDSKQRLDALRRFSTNRFLIGNLLNAMQGVSVENVQLVRFKLDQYYQLVEETRPASSEGPPPKPATATEKIILTLNAKDGSINPGDAVGKFQNALTGSPYFQDALARGSGFRLTTLGAPQSDPEGKPFVLFTLEARYPEKTR